MPNEIGKPIVKLKLGVHMDELDEFHYHEMLDRLAVTCDNIEHNLINHIVCEKHIEVERALEVVQKSLNTIYNTVALESSVKYGA